MGEPMEWWQWIVKIVLGIILLLVAVGSALFGYICAKAQAKSWAAGCFTVTAVSILAFAWLIFFVW
jgi:quinol-cytochrome oxidoreductase complex cytochrome b subunit